MIFCCPVWIIAKTSYTRRYHRLENIQTSLDTPHSDLLLYKNYAENICKKVTAGISALRRLKDFGDRETLLSVYNALIYPYFKYCCEVWDVFGETQSKRLQKLQNRAARIITNLSNDVDHSIALGELSWEPLKADRKKTKAKMMYKLLNNVGPNSFTNLFSYKSELTNYNLQDISSGLQLPKPRTNNMKKSFMYDGAFLWNSIPREIRGSTSLNSFQEKIATCTDIWKDKSAVKYMHVYRGYPVNSLITFFCSL